VIAAILADAEHDEGVYYPDRVHPPQCALSGRLWPDSRPPSRSRAASQTGGLLPKKARPIPRVAGVKHRAAAGQAGPVRRVAGIRRGANKAKDGSAAERRRQTVAPTARDFAAETAGRNVSSGSRQATGPERTSTLQTASTAPIPILGAQATGRAGASAQQPDPTPKPSIAPGATATVTATSRNSHTVTPATALPARTPPEPTALLVPSSEGKAASRRPAWWVLLTLAAVAVLVVGLLSMLPSRTRAGRGSERLAGDAATTSTSQPAVGTATAQTGASTAASAPTRSASTSGPLTQASTANQCASTAGCVVAGDDGGVVAALNAYRTSHGRAAAPGATTGQAQQCALSQGNGSTCAPHYAWQPVPTRDGTRVINMIASRSDGRAWLLDPQMTSFSVGWAYQPGGAGQYECAILKVD